MERPAVGLLALRLIRRVSSFASPAYEGRRYHTAPFAISFAPPNGANVINQLLGASGAVVFLAM